MHIKNNNNNTGKSLIIQTTYTVSAIKVFTFNFTTINISRFLCHTYLILLLPSWKTGVSIPISCFIGNNQKLALSLLHILFALFSIPFRTLSNYHTSKKKKDEKKSGIPYVWFTGFLIKCLQCTYGSWSTAFKWLGKMSLSALV